MEEFGTKKTALLIDRFLNAIERIGNRLPDPAVLFLISLITIWVLSLLLAPVSFTEIDPRSGEPISVNNLLTGAALANFLSSMVTTFTSFAPLGVVLVAMLGVGVAEHSGYINSGLKLLLNITPKSLLTPMVIFVGILSHSAVDAGYVLVIPLGGIIFHAAGRHPLAGIAAPLFGQRNQSFASRLLQRHRERQLAQNVNNVRGGTDSHVAEIGLQVTSVIPRCFVS